MWCRVDLQVGTSVPSGLKMEAEDHNHTTIKHTNTLINQVKLKLSRFMPWRHMGGGGERRYSSYSYLTSALDGGEWSASRPGRALPPGKWSAVPIVQVAGWAPEPVWTQGLEEKSSASVGDRTLVVQSVVSHNTDWVTPDPSKPINWLYI
jgi:hypothetical protein